MPSPLTCAINNCGMYTMILVIKTTEVPRYDFCNQPVTLPSLNKLHPIVNNLQLYEELKQASNICINLLLVAENSATFVPSNIHGNLGYIIFYTTFLFYTRSTYKNSSEAEAQK